jgi:hypothetical protein
LKLKQQLSASGISEDQAEKIAIAKGMPVTEVQKLRARLQQVQSASTQVNPNAVNQQNNQFRGNRQDTGINSIYADTSSREPLIDPRILGLNYSTTRRLIFSQTYRWPRRSTTSLARAIS